MFGKNGANLPNIGKNGWRCGKGKWTGSWRISRRSFDGMGGSVKESFRGRIGRRVSPCAVEKPSGFPAEVRREGKQEVKKEEARSADAARSAVGQ